MIVLHQASLGEAALRKEEEQLRAVRDTLVKKSQKVKNLKRDFVQQKQQHVQGKLIIVFLTVLSNSEIERKEEGNII